MRASDGESDKFYTKPEVAAYAVSLIPEIEGYADIVEPSAGAGAFLGALPKRTRAYDIEPDRDGIQQADWLKFRKRVSGGLLVGNPPFGKRSSLAKAFIKHGIALGFSTIAFILPETFRKLSTQRCFPSAWRLIVNVDLPHDIFEHASGDVRIPCVFQVWTNTPGDLNLRAETPQQPDAFAYLPRGSGEADVCLNGNSGRVRSPHDVTNPKAEHYIKVLRGGDETVSDLRELPLDFRSSVSGGVAWVSKNEINAAWWVLQKRRRSKSGAL